MEWILHFYRILCIRASLFENAKWLTVLYDFQQRLVFLVFTQRLEVVVVEHVVVVLIAVVYRVLQCLKCLFLLASEGIAARHIVLIKTFRLFDKVFRDFCIFMNGCGVEDIYQRRK